MSLSRTAVPKSGIHVWRLERKGKHPLPKWISLNSMNCDNVRKWDGYQGYLKSNRSILVRHQFSVVNGSRYLLSITIGGNVCVTRQCPLVSIPLWILLWFTEFSENHSGKTSNISLLVWSKFFKLLLFKQYNIHVW